MEHERIALLQGLRLGVTMMMEQAERKKSIPAKIMIVFRKILFCHDHLILAEPQLWIKLWLN